MIRPWVWFVLLLAVNSGAVAQSVEPEVVAPEGEAAPALNSDRRELSVLRPREAAALNDTGANGEIYTTSPPAPYTGTGVLLLAKSGTPDILNRLGTATSASEFLVFDSADFPLLTVTGDRKVGIGTRAPSEALHIVKDGTAAARVRIDNANTAGSASVLFTDGTAVRGELASFGSATGSAKTNLLQLWNYSGGAMVFGLADPAVAAPSNNFERMRIKADGAVGIGTSSPSHRLTVVNTVDKLAAISASTATTVEDSLAQADQALLAVATQTVGAGVAHTGKVIGTISRAWLDGAGRADDAIGLSIEAGVRPAATGSVARARGVFVNIPDSDGTVETAYGFMVGSIVAQAAYGVYLSDMNGTATAYGIYQVGKNDPNYFAGNVGIGVTAPTRALEVAGDAHFSGTVTGHNIKAKYQDVAEWVPATADLAPGTVVVLNPSRDNEVMMSGTPYDTTVAGVVSEQPGLSLGEEGEGKEQIATTGRVKVRADARRAPIRVGDLLVTSSTPGTAMRSEPVALDGHAFHRPGTIIGKALQPLPDGVGEILVLLSMQ